MKTILIAFGSLILVIGVIALVIGSIFAGTYNNLITKKTTVETQWSQVEAQLQRRFDLVPGLVSSVKGAMAQEQKVFKDIDDARTKYAGAQTTQDKATAAGGYESAIGRLLVVMENYPQLASIGTVKDLMTSLEGTENRISVARQRYNEAVQDYNTTYRRFPTNVIAMILGLKEEKPFESVAGADQPVQFDLTK